MWLQLEIQDLKTSKLDCAIQFQCYDFTGQYIHNICFNKVFVEKL